MQKGDLEEYRRLAGPWRRSPRQDKQQWTDQIASSGETHLLRSKMHLLSSTSCDRSARPCQHH